MIQKIKCFCGGKMDLEHHVRTESGTQKVFLCRECILAWTPRKQWIPNLKEAYFKLPSGEITAELDLSMYAETHPWAWYYRLKK